MLYLNRKVGESIIINNNVELTLVEVKGNSAKLGFVFPPHVSVLRKELHEKLMEENMMAAAGKADDGDALSALFGPDDDSDVGGGEHEPG